MMKSWSRAFPYVKGRPSITVRFRSTAGKARYFELLIDSGADYSIISKSDAIALGIDYNHIQCKEKRVEAANMSSIHVKDVRLSLSIDKLSLTVPVLISREYSEALLGRKGIFSRFDILFQENQNQVTFTKN